MIIAAKYSGYCLTCHTEIYVGDSVGWQKGLRGVYCLQCCPSAVRTAKPPPRPYDGASSTVPKANGVPTALASSDPWLGVLLALQEAIMERWDDTMQQELERDWKLIEKCTALALQPGTDAEGRAALRAAILKAVKVAFR